VHLHQGKRERKARGAFLLRSTTPARALQPPLSSTSLSHFLSHAPFSQPKLVTLMTSKFPAVPLAFIDVNAVPSAVVSGAGVTKMPTIVVYVKGEIAGTYVAGESAPTAVLAVEAMVEKAVKTAKAAK